MSNSGSFCSKPFAQLCPSSLGGPAPDSNPDRFPLTDQHDQPLTPCDARVEEVAREHGVVLRHHGNDHGRVL